MILAAGLGTRLRPITYDIPKPMVSVCNRPVMEHIARHLVSHGFTDVIANLHWFPDTIREHFGDGSDFGFDLSYSPEEQLLGTSGGVRNAAEFLGDSFLVISGDALTDIDLTQMREAHESHDGIATLATRRVDDTTQFGVVITDGEGRVQGFQEKPEPSEALSDLANCGIYMFRSEIFDYFPAPGESKAAGDDDPEGFADWAMDVFPALLDGDVPFYSHEIDAYWNDIGNLEELHSGNFDALAGSVKLEPAGELAEDGDDRFDGPVLLGDGAEIDPEAKVTGPAVIGPRCKIGAGAMLKEVVVLADTEVPDGAVAAGGILSTRRSRALH
jgi:mannose-1-phosphate guanylyltransferase/mannose-1-phosphate guanylyltransferase/phosphomannomutase